MDFKLTQEQTARISKFLTALERDDKGQFHKKITVWGYSELLYKIIALIKAAKEICHSMNNNGLEKEMILDVFYLLELAESLTDLYEEMELFDSLKNEVS